jgi:formylglycine-generating enzyme required for sulfatase activity
MERLHYLDFELKIEREGDRYAARVLHSPAGEASHSFVLPFSEDRLENLLLKIGGRRLGPTRRINSTEMEAARELGGKLFKAVFGDEVRTCFGKSLDEALRQKEIGIGLRMKLRLQEVPELADLPWEFLYNATRNRFYAQSNQTPIVRYIEMSERVTPIAISLPLQVLVVISSPTGDPSSYPLLNVEREKSVLQEALDPLFSRQQVQVKWLEKPTMHALQRCLRKGTYHVFHFIGHGGFNKQREEGGLILEGEQGRSQWAGAERLSVLLHDHRCLRLAVLNCCEGALNSPTDPFAGVATSLIWKGIPAVVAMQFEFSDRAAITFSSEFYDALAQGFPVDAAVAEARKAIYFLPNDLEWGTPVLYMRSPDGVLFNLIQKVKAEDKHHPEEKSIDESIKPKEQRRKELEEEYDLLSQKIARLKKARILETDAATRFKLDKQIEDAELDRKNIEKQLEALLQTEQPQQEEMEAERLHKEEEEQKAMEKAETERRQKETEAERLREEEEARKAAEKVKAKPRRKRRKKKEEEEKGQEFEFDVITVNAEGHEIQRTRVKAYQQIEDLGNGIILEMVSIPGGTFIMGSPQYEEGRHKREEKSWFDRLFSKDEPDSRESPQHKVTVAPFYMGKYPVTQEQWEALMGENPSNSKGAKRPVECVSWHDAKKFCERLSGKTGRTYRLPSEAEWEYACRAGTTTPFHFGETLTTDLANYDGNYIYASGPKGVYREQTTDVGSFSPNAFGLYDMHGNVWEWCADPWHENYEGAPSDGRVWKTGGDDSDRLLRGGSWSHVPNGCRSAYRVRGLPDGWVSYCGGFRVVVSSAWTLQ